MFQATLAGCARMGRWRECIVTLDQMRKSGLQPRAAAYNSVITACGRGGEWQRAIAILKQMSSRGATPDVITLNAVMTSCTQVHTDKREHPPSAIPHPVAILYIFSGGYCDVASALGSSFKATLGATAHTRN